MSKWKGRIKGSLSDLFGFVLAWIAQVFAFLGGAFAAETILGDAIESVLEFIPWGWVPVALVFAAGVSVLLDLLWDLLPERLALWCSLALPSMATAVPGKFGDTVSDWANTLQGSLQGSLREWFGGQPALGLAVICVVMVVMTAKYALPKSGGHGGRM
ncbi:hypothetical protein [Micromonospora sp. NPDC005652]|uniref:hypothetical protein n=1 Tax=Micromonospora sp. NPDC005652 TaxID=3157046 RepID=UPI0033C770AF